MNLCSSYLEVPFQQTNNREVRSPYQHIRSNKRLKQENSLINLCSSYLEVPFQQTNNREVRSPYQQCIAHAKSRSHSVK